jgi:hypothetical protein
LSSVVAVACRNRGRLAAAAFAELCHLAII